MTPQPMTAEAATQAVTQGAIWMPREIVVKTTDSLVPYARNSRDHSQHQIELIAASIRRFGFLVPVLIDASGGIIAGHGRTMAAKLLHMPEVPCVVGSHLTEVERRAYVIADNRLAELATWNANLALETSELDELGFDMPVLGFSEKELAELNPPVDPTAIEGQDECAVPAAAISRQGDLWRIGYHALVCGDCRDGRSLDRLVAAAGSRINLAVTSPPYAAQRTYDKNSGFEPITPEAYVAWYAGVAAAMRPHMAEGASYFMNIKEHAEGGQRHLYVKELTVAHVRLWGWKFIDEFCWKKQGVPGGWKNRFKNAWEPVFHFALSTNVNFYPLDVSHISKNAFDYSSAAHQVEKNLPKARGYEDEDPNLRNGLGQAAGKARKFVEVGANEKRSESMILNRTGLARPSNVVEVSSESENNGHPAAYPVALPEFFIRAFTQSGDLVYDPFQGSGTTLVATEKNGRRGCGCELSPLYTDMILWRMMKLFPGIPVTHENGQTFQETAAERGVPFAPPPAKGQPEATSSSGFRGSSRFTSGTELNRHKADDAPQAV